MRYLITVTFLLAFAANATEQVIQLEAYVVKDGECSPAFIDRCLPLFPHQLASTEAYTCVRYVVSEENLINPRKRTASTNKHFQENTRRLERRWVYQDLSHTIIMVQPIYFGASSHQPTLLASK